MNPDRLIKGRPKMRIDFNTMILLIIAVEVGLIYVKMGRK